MSDVVTDPPAAPAEPVVTEPPAEVVPPVVVDEGQAPASVTEPATPAVDAPPAEPPASTITTLEDALSALEEVRREAAENRVKRRETEAKFANAKTPEEVEALIAEVKATEATEARNLLVENVALANGVPSDLHSMLTGSTRDELEAQAKTLKKYLNDPEPKDDPPLGGGLDGSGDAGAAFDPVAYAQRARNKRF